MSHAGIDSRRSWLVAVACFVVQIVTFGLTESQGLLFVYTVFRFKTSRQLASLPFTLAYCVRSAIGPFIGYVGRRFGIRTVTLCGSILECLSVAACFFAEDIVELTILWGVVFGIALGLETSLLSVIINEHFVKHRVTANGLNVSGASIGVLVLSPVIHYLAETYGLSGTFLIISGIMLHGIPAAYLMIITKPEEPPTVPPIHFRNDSITIASISTAQSPSVVQKMPVWYKTPGEENTNIIGDRNQPNIIEDRNQHNIVEDTNQRNRIESANQRNRIEQANHVKNYMSHAPDPYVVLSVYQQKSQNDGFFSKLFNKKRTYTINSVVGELKRVENVKSRRRELDKSLTYDSVFTRRMSRNNYSTKLATNQIDTPAIDSDEVPTPDQSKWQVRRLFRDPIYICIVIGSGIYYFSITTTYTIIIDYAQDIGVPKENSAHILMWIAASDMCAFPFLGWIIERGYLSQSHYAALSFLGMSLTSQALVWCPSTTVLLIIVTCFELSQCGVIILTAPLVAEYMDTDLQATGIASVTILSSPMTLAISPLVGYFRDEGGSYAGVFFVISGATLLCSILSACIPLLEQRRKKPERKRKIGMNLALVGGH